MRPFQIRSLDELAPTLPPLTPTSSSPLEIWAAEKMAFPSSLQSLLVRSGDLARFLLHEEDGLLRADPFRIAKFDHCILNSRTGILFPEKDVALAESWYSKKWFEKSLREKLFPLEEMLFVPSETHASAGDGTMAYEPSAPGQIIPHPVFLLTHQPELSAYNYAHWMLEILPRLAAAKALPILGRMKVLVPATLIPFQRETLTALGIGEKQMHPIAGKSLLFAQAYVPTYPAAGGYSRAQVQWLSQHLPAAFPLSKPAPPHRKIYISREDAKERRVTNHSEVETFLRSRGFETIIPGKLTVAQQIQTFQEAQVIVAPHGAACVNLVFCQPKTTLIELLPPTYPHPMYGILSHLAELDYHPLFCPSSLPLHDLTVDLNELGHHLS